MDIFKRENYLLQYIYKLYANYMQITCKLHANYMQITCKLRCQFETKILLPKQ